MGNKTLSAILRMNIYNKYIEYLEGINEGRSKKLRPSSFFRELITALVGESKIMEVEIKWL